MSQLDNLENTTETTVRTSASLRNAWPPPLDLKAFNDANGFTGAAARARNKTTYKERPASPPGSSATASQDGKVKYARAALRGEVDAVATCTSLRNNRLNEAAVKLFSYVASGVLDEEEVTRELHGAALACGLDEDEIIPTIQSGRRKGISQPHDMSGIGALAGYEEVRIPGWDEILMRPQGSPPAVPTFGQMDARDINANVVCPAGMEDNPHRLAKLYLNQHSHADGACVRYWNECFHVWDGAAYRILPEKELKAKINGFIAKEFDRLHNLAMMKWGMAKASAANANSSGSDGSGGGSSKPDKASAPPKPIPVTVTLVNNVVQAVAGLVLLHAKDYPNQPVWLPNGDGLRNINDWPVTEILAAKNMLIHLPSFIDGKPCTRPTTPTFFTPNALDYDFATGSGEPTEWLNFLYRIWGDDSQSIDTLQEWMGYLLTQDKSQQKILLMIGPKRSGKGTIAKVIREMVGRENVTHPRMSLLAGQYGAKALVGKSVAIIDDARVSNKIDAAAVVEQLLTISGDATQTVERKYMEELTIDLTTRIIINSNEIPKLKDDSGALASRFLILEMTRSFYGQEDTELYARLRPEIPKILQWAIVGWGRLRERKKFIQPDSGDCLRELMEEMSSPISAFLAETCEIRDPANLSGDADEVFEVDVAELFNLWKSWNLARAVEYKGGANHFSRLVKSAAPIVKHRRDQIAKSRKTILLNIRQKFQPAY